MKLRVLAVFVLFASMFASAHSSAAGLQQSDRLASAKIATWVLEHTADGKEAEFLVVLSDQADLSAAEALQTKEEKGRYVYKTLYEKAQVTQRPILDWLQANGVEHRSYYIVNMIWVKGKIDVANSLAARSDVARIDGNPVIHNNLPQPSLPPSSPLAPEAIEPGISYSNAPQVWALGYTGQGMVVGGADTGYRWDHNALKPHYRGWNGTTANHDYNWHDSIHSSLGPCVGNSVQPCDDHNHGTHTMGTAIGDDGGTNQIGMAPGAKWIGCRNMDQGNGTPATYTECFQFFLAPYPVGGTTAQGDPTKAPDVTTNSWGCPPSEGCTSVTWLTIQSAIQANRAAGIVTVVAAGNSGSSCSTVSDAPSFFPEVLTVGALNTGLDSIASFSSRGPVTIDGSNRQKPDIAAPGTSTRSAIKTTTSSYSNAFSGTSMATPHVAGAVALLLSADPSRRGQVSTIEGILKDSAFHIPSASCSSSGVPNNVFGYGRLDVRGAVDLAQTTIAPSSTVAERRGGRGMVVVNAPTITTQWTAVSNNSWILMTSPPGGTGSGLVTYELRENFTGHFRIGTLTVAQRTFTITQSGVAPGSCDNTIAPMGSAVGKNGGFGLVTITAGAECIWTAATGTSWITITSGSSGIGNGSVNYSIAQNNTGVARKGSIAIAGRTFNVKQAAN